jgi:hypothetical protein
MNIKYTVSWTQKPEDWNIPGTIKLLEAVRKKAIDAQKKKLEESSLAETKKLLEKVSKL